MILPDEMTPAMKDALGLMCFTTGPMAHLFNAAGAAQIPPKVEEEQAFILFWALKLSIEHGDKWREAAGDKLRELQAALPKAKKSA